MSRKKTTTISAQEAARRAWATVSKASGGGKKSRGSASSGKKAPAGNEAKKPVRGRDKIQAALGTPAKQALAKRSIFISHSSKDVQTAQALTDLFRSALAISPTDIRCTSLEGHLLPAGASVDELLRREVHGAKAFVGLISYSSLQSLYVVFELGARWGAGKHLIPLLAPGVSPDALKAPLSSFNSLSCGSASQLHQLVRELASLLEVELHPPFTYQREIDGVLNLPRAQGSVVVPKCLEKELELDYSARRDNLPDSQKEILKYLEKQSNKRASMPQSDFEAEFRGRIKSVYWRLESLCHLGFVEKEVTDHNKGIPRYNYRLSGDYAEWRSKLKGRKGMS